MKKILNKESIRKNAKKISEIVTANTLSLSLIISSACFINAKNTTHADAKDVTITISAAGDCTFGSDRMSPSSSNFYAMYNKKNNKYFFKKVKKVFKNDDMSIVNFEGVLTKRNTRADKKYAFKGEPSYYKILKKGSIEAVAFANNHAYDYGVGSYNDTINVFKKHKIKFSSYAKLGIYKTKGKKIGMVSVTCFEDYQSSASLIKSGIKKLRKKKVNIVIVSMHGGVEYMTTPNEKQKYIAHYAVDCGADLVLGHHPHILQGVEKYKGVYIAYSLGNFCFGGNTNPRDKDTMIFRKTFRFKAGKRRPVKDNNVKIVPASLSGSKTYNNYQPIILKGSEKIRVIKKINSYSKVYGVRFGKNGKYKLKKK